MKLNHQAIQKAQHQIFNIMENHFEKLIKMSEKDLDYNAINIQQKSFINNYIQKLKLF